jgi:Ca2+-binding EF-hand superfamily protein
MLFALGAVSSALDALQSITSKSSSGQSSGSGKAATNPFDLVGSTQPAGTVTPSSGTTNSVSQISPQTMSALLAAQSQSTNSTGSTPSVSSDPLQNLFSLIDGNGDGKISKSEFESALGAGGTNLANADSVFGKLDKNGDGNVSLDEMKSALQGAGGHHHHHAASPGDAGGDAGGSKGSSDPLAQALAGASSTSVTNADGSTTTSLTYADGSKVTMTTAVPATGSSASAAATSSYNFIEKMIQREAQALSSSATNSLALSA